jgi:hypothetical protein
MTLQHLVSYQSNIISNTLEERKINTDPSFPQYLIPIHALGNGELSCLDISQMNEEGECPIVAWYFGATLHLYNVALANFIIKGTLLIKTSKAKIH